LYDHLAANRGIGFVNQDEAYLADMAAAVSRVIPYFDSDAPSVSVPGMEIRRDGLSPTVSVAFLSDGELISATTQLSGQHNLQNIKTAIAVGKYFKVPGRQIAAALREYAPENHRSQWLTHRGIRFYWDAYNANPSSVAASLESFATLSEPAASVVVLGEMRELGEASAAAHRRVALRAGQVARTVLLVGEGMRSTAEEFDRPHFTDSSVLKDWFWAQDWTDKQVFVKGSRGNRLERLLD
jgi:UDP-N-acetylmuramoyl-tripeptide--D-alanyl-D-alanine ligase